MTGKRLAARNHTSSCAESLKLINVTKHAERDGCWTTVKEVSGKLHSVTTVQTVFTGLIWSEIIVCHFRCKQDF